MDPYRLIDKYYNSELELKEILITHSKEVMNKALEVVKLHPELEVDVEFIKEAAMLHDIGIFMTNAPSIKCFGTAPYIAHGYLGSELLMKEGFPRHALVCERHTGTGISLDDIITQNLPIPHRDMRPQSLEEQLICFADKFFSKSKLGYEKPIEKVRRDLEKFGHIGVVTFDKWCRDFL